jgi:hypothetical protein
MGTGTILLGMLTFSLLLFVLVGGPAILTDWLRRRREEATRRQIAITDAIDRQFGPIVSPVVKNPLRGPWQVQIAVPIMRPGAVGLILQLVDEVFTKSNDMGVDRYRIVLTPTPDGIHQETESRTSQGTASWLADHGLAA